jgi:ribonuclease BN (tRNA processing enzyme)
MLKLTFLGTSSGVPTIRRNVTALAVQTGQGRDWWLVDCGEATQHRLQRTPLSVHDLAGICITHIHGDHSYGLPGLLASASMTGRKRPLILIAPPAVKRWVDATLLHTELFLTFPLVHVDVDPRRSCTRSPACVSNVLACPTACRALPSVLKSNTPDGSWTSPPCVPAAFQPGRIGAVCKRAKM